MVDHNQHLVHREGSGSGTGHKVWLLPGQGVYFP